MPRFEQRSRKLEDDGSDFRHFVGELFRELPDFDRPVICDSGSVDGGIDLFCSTTNAAFECKFIGASPKDETGRAFQEWKQTSDRLKKNLIASPDTANTFRSPYAPWLDRLNAIKKYYFVVSAVLANLSQQHSLQRKIEEFFLGLSKHAGLEHLNGIAVEVIDWNKLEAMAERMPHIFYKWLFQLPSGFTPLQDAEQSSFKSYLNNDTLPFLSRVEVEAASGEQSPWNEKTIIQELSSDSGVPHIVIGEGGVGKTRLALDVARQMKASGYLVFSCDGMRVTTTGLRQLITTASTNSKFLLLSDYVEQWPGLDAFSAEAVDIALQTGHRISILGTCRLSYRDRLPNRLRQWRIGGQSKFEAEYANAVCTHILSNAKIEDAADLSKKCRSNLAIASFLAFLKSNRPEQFLSEVQALRSEPSFESWIVRRLNPGGFEDIAAAAAVMAACSFPFEKLSALEAAHRASARLIHTLIADRWLESIPSKDGLTWSSFHDLFSDTLIAKSFELAPAQYYWAITLLRLASELGVASQTLTSLARCVVYPAIAAIDWLSVLAELESAIPCTLANNARSLLATPLLSPSNRLSLLLANEGFRDRIVADLANDILIAELAKDLADRQETEGYWTCLIPMLDAMLDRSTHGHIALRYAFIAQPAHYKDRVKNWIAQHSVNFNAHYILSTWIYEAGGIALDDPKSSEVYCNEMLGYIRDWLTANPHKIVAVSIFDAWLATSIRIGGSAGKKMFDEIRPYIADWLLNGTVAGGSRFLNFARFFISAAENLAPEILQNLLALIDPHIDRWFSHPENCNSPDCYKLLLPMLIAAEILDGDDRIAQFDRAEDFTKQWLASTSGASRRNAGTVYSHLLAASAKLGRRRVAQSIDWVYPPITDWLSRFADDESDAARHIMDSLLYAASELSVLQRETLALELSPYFLKWLSVGDNSTSADVALLYRNWIYCAPLRSINDIEERVVRWLPTEEDEEKFSLFVSAWQERGLPFQVISPAVYDRFMKQRHREGAAWLLKTIVREESLPITISRAAAEWCIAFPGHEDTLARLSNIVRRKGLDETFKTDAITNVLNAQAIEDLISTPFRLVAGRRLLSYLLSAGQTDRKTRAAARSIFYDWLTDGRVFRPASQFEWHPQELQVFDQRVPYLHGLKELVSSGELKPHLRSEERSGCRSFAAWVAEWEQPKPHEVRSTVEALTAICGMNNIWNVMLSKKHQLPER